MNEVYWDDLREKTHRGMTGSFARGFNPGGKAYGYRSVRLPADPARPHNRREASRLEIEPAEAEVVRRIFREYASGQSLRSLAAAIAPASARSSSPPSRRSPPPKLSSPPLRVSPFALPPEPTASGSLPSSNACRNCSPRTRPRPRSRSPATSTATSRFEPCPRPPTSATTGKSAAP